MNPELTLTRGYEEIASLFLLVQVDGEAIGNVLALVYPIAAVLCLLAGVSWTRFRWAPLLATAAVAIPCFLFVVVSGIWAADCWDCVEGINLYYYEPITRGDHFIVGLGFSVVPAAAVIVLAWLPVAIAFAWRRWTGSEP